MSSHTSVPLRQRWTASQLRRLPARQRNQILRAAAAKAAKDYRTDPQLTDFEAFGPEDLDGGSAGAHTR